MNDRIERLKNRIEDEAVTEIHDRASLACQGAVAIGRIIPNFRAVRMAIGVVRSAATVARAVSAGDSLPSALIAGDAVSISGIEFLKPDTRGQLESAQKEVENFAKGSSNRKLGDC